MSLYSCALIKNQLVKNVDLSILDTIFINVSWWLTLHDVRVGGETHPIAHSRGKTYGYAALLLAILPTPRRRTQIALNSRLFNEFWRKCKNLGKI